MKRSRKVLALLLCVTLIVSVGALSAVAATYAAQGTGGNTLTMLTPSDITDNTAEGDTYFSNTINTELDPTADIVFSFTMSSGMNNFNETQFIEINMPQIAVCDSYGGDVIVQPTFVSGGSDGISISVAADTLTDGSYVLVFGENIQGNNSDKTLGQDIVFTFTAVTGAQADTETEEDTEPVEEEEQTSPFTDVPTWAEEYVAAVIENGCMEGTSETTFDPDAVLTRGEFVTILGKARGINAGKYTTSVFSDIADEDECSPYAAWASGKEIIEGYGDGLFGPDDTLTREQVVTILYRYATVFSMDTTADGDISAFSDGASVSSWAQTAMAWAIGQNYISGFDNGLLIPTGEITRVQAAKLITLLVLSA